MAAKGFRARFEAAIFDALARGDKPIDVASRESLSMQTVYAIDKREAVRRGIPRNLGKEKTA